MRCCLYSLCGPHLSKTALPRSKKKKGMKEQLKAVSHPPKLSTAFGEMGEYCPDFPKTRTQSNAAQVEKTGEILCPMEVMVANENTIFCEHHAVQRRTHRTQVPTNPPKPTRTAMHSLPQCCRRCSQRYVLAAVKLERTHKHCLRKGVHAARVTISVRLNRTSIQSEEAVLLIDEQKPRALVRGRSLRVRESTRLCPQVAQVYHEGRSEVPCSFVHMYSTEVAAATSARKSSQVAHSLTRSSTCTTSD